MDFDRGKRYLTAACATSHFEQSRKAKDKGGFLCFNKETASSFVIIIIICLLCTDNNKEAERT